MGTAKTNKTREVLKHLKQHKTITSMEAIQLFGATRLSAIIFCLRKAGYDIETIDTVGVDRYGNRVDFATYKYIGGIEDENS